jgi:hypothetical protein
VLHGRRAELRELLDAAAAAIKGGRGLTALIGGDAGIGKTRLAAEVAERLRADGIAVAWAACPQDGGAPPFWPWAQLLARLGRPGALAAPDRTTPEHARFLVVEAVTAALEAVAPVLLVLDDLHWADDASLHLLSALGAHVAAPVLVLGTYRDTEPGGVAALPAERRLTLTGLSVDELGPAVAELTGEAMVPDLLGPLHRRTGGNPYFAAEVVRLLRAEGGLQEGAPRSVGAVPGGVRSVLERRLDRLPEPTETVLRAAAALDAGTTDGVDAILLAAVAECLPTELEERLRPAVEARLVIVEGGAHRFPHALVAETVGGRTPAAQRLELHRRAAATLGVRAAAGIDDPAGFAHQLLAAARLSGEPREAAAAASAGADAARAAMERTAYEDATAWLEAALAVLPADGDEPDRGELLCDLGDAALAAGDTARSRSAYAAAASHARRHRLPALLAAAALGTTGGQAGFEVDLADPDRVALLEEARDAVPPGSTAWGALSARLSIALAFSGVESRRLQLAEDAVATARAADDPRALVDALAARCEALAGPDHVRARRAAAEEIIACAPRARDRMRELLGRRLRIVALAESGDWVALDGEIESYARVSGRVRRPGSSWYVPLWRGARAAMRGDAEAEAAHRAELAADVERSGSVNAELLSMTQRLCRAVHGKRPAEVAALTDRFFEISGYIQAAGYCTRALLAALSGDDGDAARLVEAFLDARASTARDSEWLPEMVQAAMTAALIGHRGVAADVYDALEPYAGLFAIEGIFAGTWGCVDAHLGRLARLTGRVEDAERHETAGRALNAAAGAGVAEWTATWTGTGTPSAGSAPGAAAVFRLDGEVWVMRYAGRAAQLRDAKGMHDLAALIRRPGRDVAVHELVGAGPGNSGVELADPTSVASYRQRLVEVAEDLAEAEAMHDLVRAERAAAERDALVDELAAVTGLGGRARRAGSDAERMRKAVGNRIRQALARIEAAHPELGRHLRLSVRTGTFCRYEPDAKVRWEL